MLRRYFSLAAFVSFAGFCFAQTTPTSTPGSAPAIGKTGIDGTITSSPSHPGPVKPGIQNSRPLANTTFVVSNQSGASTEFTTNEQGHFHVLLGPGHYTVTKKGEQTRIGRCGPFDVFVAAGQITHVEWACDTGMR